MRERLREILDRLLLCDEGIYLPVPVLARELGAGVRTVFRDIQELDSYLKGYGVSIDKKRSAGIRLIGSTALIPSAGKINQARLAGLSLQQRQLSLLIYLGHTHAIVKLNELATFFSVSDSCISTDLKELDAFLLRHALKAVIVRLKGIGVVLEGDEWDIRMAVVGGASMLILPQELMQLFLFEREHTKVERMIMILGFSSGKEKVLQAIRDTEKRMGYRFSWYDLGLVFLYLLIALERKKSKLDEADHRFSKMIMSVSAPSANFLWKQLSPENSETDRVEILFLQAVLSSIEPGELRETKRTHPDVSRIVSTLIAEIGNTGYFRYDFDAGLFLSLQTNLSALVYKKHFGLPVRPPLVKAGDTADLLGDSVFGILHPLLKQSFDIDLGKDEIEPMVMALRASDESLPGIHPKPRLLVTCFEGIFLAQFIASIIKTYFPDVTVVASLSCDRISDEYLMEKRIDLVITTFPAGLVRAPEYVVSTPFEITVFRREMEEVLSRFEPNAAASAVHVGTEDLSSIDISISILQGFKLKVLSHDVQEKDLTSVIALEVCGDKKAALALKKDFDIRESFGAVVLEQSGIRMFHCRSSAVREPVAGVIRAGAKDTFVYLVAPDPASHEDVQALSKISVALMESPDFIRALVTLGEKEIKRSLFAFLASTL